MVKIVTILILISVELLFMTHTLSSAYTGLTKLLTETGHFITPAELQGLLWGITVAGAKEQSFPELSIILGEGELTESIQQAIEGLKGMIRKEFTDESVTITLLMPIDDEPLVDRLNAMINWSNGFLAGFGLIKQDNSLPKEVLEILADIDAITQLQIEIKPEDEPRSERDYMELIEFLKVVPLLVATELKSHLGQPQTVH